MGDFTSGDPRFRDIFLQAPVGIVILKPSGEIVEANEALHRLLGYASGELDGKQVADLLPPEDRADAQREGREALGGRFTIDSAPGRGTTIRVDLPLSAGRT